MIERLHLARFKFAANRAAPILPASLAAASVQAVIRGAEARLTGRGRLLIRKSGTEPLIRVMAECEDEAMLAEVVDGIVAAVRAAV